MAPPVIRATEARPSTPASIRRPAWLWTAQATSTSAPFPATGIVTTVAGNGAAGYAGNGGAAIKAKLSGPSGEAVDGAGNVYIADTQNNAIRKVVAATGIITTVAGNGAAGYSGDGGPATKAEL